MLNKFSPAWAGLKFLITPQRDSEFHQSFTSLWLAGWDVSTYYDTVSKIGIQRFRLVTQHLDSVFQRSDDFLRSHQYYCYSSTL